VADARTKRFRTALDFLSRSGAHKLLGGLTRGAGVVFTLHHVRPWDGRAFAPNRLLEITPEFLDAVLGYLREADYDIVTLDEAVARLGQRNARRFASFTFDDGYRDVRDYALPVMRRHGAPATLFVATAFADGTGDLWWLTLEHVIERMPVIEFGGEAIDTSTAEKKYAAWDRVYWQLRAMDEIDMRAAIARMAERARLDASGAAKALCMNWDELRVMAADPLVAIGNHTVSHYMLAKHPSNVALAEIADAQARIVRELNVVPRHLAYPVGDPTSAGQREFSIARELGFAGGWTTRLGVLHRAHAAHPTALPRVSLNGHYQERKYAELFVSGLPFAINNRFRRLNVG
jgi:peptidoglycan/xylan/chitin deacetylase (PgdA/CDA1 family)